MQTQVFDHILELRDLHRACDGLHALVDPGFGAPGAWAAEPVDRLALGAMLRVMSRDLARSLRGLESQLRQAGIVVPEPLPGGSEGAADRRAP